MTIVRTHYIRMTNVHKYSQQKDGKCKYYRRMTSVGKDNGSIAIEVRLQKDG